MYRTLLTLRDTSLPNLMVGLSVLAKTSPVVHANKGATILQWLLQFKTENMRKFF